MGPLLAGIELLNFPGFLDADATRGAYHLFCAKYDCRRGHRLALLMLDTDILLPARQSQDPARDHLQRQICVLRRTGLVIPRLSTFFCLPAANIVRLGN